MQGSIGELYPRLEKVLRLRLGVDIHEPGKNHTTAEIAEILGLRKKRVKELEKKALRELSKTWGILHNDLALVRARFIREARKTSRF